LLPQVALVTFCLPWRRYDQHCCRSAPTLPMTLEPNGMMMRANLRGTVAAMACALAASSVLAPQPAGAQTTLLDILFGNQRGRPLVRQEPMPQAIPAEEWRSREAARVSEPQPVVTGPTYKTYQPDAVKLVDFSGLYDPITTGSVGEGEVAVSDAPSFASAMRSLDGYSVRALTDVADAVNAYYSEHPDFIWVDEDGITPRAEAALAVLGDAGSVGLSPAGYQVEEPRLTGSREEREQEMARFEMDMAVAVLTYVLDATRGRIDPNRISGYHHFERKTVDLTSAMKVLARTGNVAFYLENRSPDNAKFKALQAELERLVALDTDSDRIEIPTDIFVRPGGQSPHIPSVVEAIKEKGSDALKVEHALTFADYKGGETYSPKLVALVTDFQAESGLTDDGIIGPNTILAMTGMSNADKIQKVRLAMERMRWLSRDLGDRHVMINAAGFTATYHEEGEDDLTMRVVVGTKANQTYFFQDKIERVEFNPYWGVPRSIIVNEMLPKLRRDPSYLDRLGYEVTTSSGVQIASSSVNWYSVGADVNLNVRQPPGPSNALGELKIMFPNRHAIYMHDTPAQELFARDTRAYSHGCVRLEDPRAMAAAVLGTSREDVSGHVANGRNHSVHVDKDIPVYVAYFTAWPDAEGKVSYYRDIYDRDMYLQRAIDSTERARHAES
jgi:murein L,D-transpeptidase YcbB/YkuD